MKVKLSVNAEYIVDIKEGEDIDSAQEKLKESFSKENTTPEVEFWTNMEMFHTKEV